MDGQGRRPEGRHEAVDAFVGFVRGLQEDLCGALEALDGAARFGRDAWERPGGGGGVTRVLEGGPVLEKAVVSVSEVHGALEPAFAATLPGDGLAFEAAGLSVIVHPRSPLVPTTHANFRLLRRGATRWLGGGSDLTPYYLFEEDARAFHATFRAACDRHDPAFYPRMKRACDAYFFLPHRGERRGVGGIFFDGLDADAKGLAFATDAARAFAAAWLPIARRRAGEPWGEAEREWQEIRRGRYVEFNLLHDRGTTFGLRTGGRVESILASMPPRVRFAYDHHPAPGSREARLVEVLTDEPRDWLQRDGS
jgi:coproporphyrinogen III oxidase